jgi:transposase
VSVIEGAPVTGRRRWSESFKAELVAKTLERDVNVSAIARGAGVHSAQLFAWRRKAIHSGAVTPLAASDGLRLVEVETAVPSPIEIIVDGVVVRAGADVSEEHLRRVLRVVRSA